MLLSFFIGGVVFPVVHTVHHGFLLSQNSGDDNSKVPFALCPATEIHEDDLCELCQRDHVSTSFTHSETVAYFVASSIEGILPAPPTLSLEGQLYIRGPPGERKYLP